MNAGAERPGQAWLERRLAGAIRALRGAISATGLERRREGFRWSVRPVAG